MFKEVRGPYKILNKRYPNRFARWVDRETGLRKNYDGTLEKPQFMKVRPTKKQKKVMAKLMYEAGWGNKRLSEWFKVTPGTVSQWTKLPTPEALKEFESRFKLAMLDMDMEGTLRIKNRILEVVPKETDIAKLVKAGEFFAGERAKSVSQNNTQVNVYGQMLQKYSNKEVEGEATIVEVK